MPDTLSDADLLNFLDSLPLPPRPGLYGWKLRISTTGRGWRLMTTTEQPNYPTVREAIQAMHDGYRAMQEAGEG